MAASLVALEAGLTEGLAGRKVHLGAALGERFPLVRDRVLAGDVPAATAHKVVDSCAGLDVEARGRVDAEVSGRLSELDPAQVTAHVRRVATRAAADQVAAQVAKSRRTRTVEVRPGPDGLTDVYALLPTATVAAAWAATEQLAGEYRGIDDTLTLSEARADAFGDLFLRNVTVSASVTLGVPVVTDRPAPEPAMVETVEVPWGDDDTVIDAYTGEETRFGDLPPEAQRLFETTTMTVDPDLRAIPMAQVTPGFAVSGTQLPGLGWVDAATVANLLKVLPMDVAGAVLDAETGTLASLTTSAYRPNKAMRDFVTTRDGTCRMWGCSRRAEYTDLDHTRPWPGGVTSPTDLACLCRRHHRLKQQGRWRPTLDPDGTLTWTSPSGTRRGTEPAHRVAASAPPDVPPF
ncbi:HNH endonuclease signature motif containing protein [Phycicoccus duodecadis]|nr:HNH endonuclease signature motif containing protein [Phycicoccus duodecadis]